jgi:UDP-N-acetylmuramoyl-tripeptide--D-alanyl-D-alanine ligase
MRAALATLADWPEARLRIAVLGDMRELGETAAELHREVGAEVRRAELWVVGEHAADYAEGAARGGVEVRRFPDKATLAAELRGRLAPGTVVLFKASRGAALEDVVAGLPVEAEEA